MNSFPKNTTANKYMCKHVEGKGKREIWTLYKKSWLFGWRKIERGSSIYIINKCKRLNGITGSHGSSVDLDAVSTNLKH